VKLSNIEQSSKIIDILIKYERNNVPIIYTSVTSAPLNFSTNSKDTSDPWAINETTEFPIWKSNFTNSTTNE
jgi:hypothetical protein